MSDISTVLGPNALQQSMASKENLALEKAKNLSSQSLKTEKDLDKATSGFEALLLHNMLKEMWATVDSSELFGGESNQGKIYQDMLNQAIADEVADGRGIGVKDFLRKELLKTGGEHLNGEKGEKAVSPGGLSSASSIKELKI